MSGFSEKHRIGKMPYKKEQKQLKKKEPKRSLKSEKYHKNLFNLLQKVVRKL